MFAQIPRDADYNASLLTTVDPDKTNMRVKMVSKIIQGFMLYLVLYGTNTIYDQRTQLRVQGMYIACNVQPSSGPTDVEGLHYMTRLRERLRGQHKQQQQQRSAAQARAAASVENDEEDAGFTHKALEKMLAEYEDEMENEYCLRKGIVRSSTNPKCRNKGPRPSHDDLKTWAPLHYFVHAAAGNLVGMMHKMGMYRLRINYGVSSVARYLFDYITSTLECFVEDTDHNASGRYYDSYRCRMVAETVHRATFMSMATCKDLDDAVTHAIGMLTYNAMHLSLLPVLVERLVQRIIQYEPLLGMATLGIYLGAPVVSMRSIMQLMNGQPVTNEEEREAMRKFVEDSITSNNAIQYIGMDALQTSSSSAQDGSGGSGGGGGDNTADRQALPGYVTCNFLRDNFVQAFDCGALGGGGGPGGGFNRGTGAGGGGGPNGGSSVNISSHGIPMDPINVIIKKLYKDNSKTLKICGFVDDLAGFTRCIHSLMSVYDLRGFFGGMAAYHDGQRMAEILGVRSSFKFASNFVDGKDGTGDPAVIAARIPRFARASPNVPFSSSHYQEADFCIGVRIWDVMAWFSIMQRPRMDIGILMDFAKTLTEHAIHLLPRSIFPYDVVPMTRIDPIERTQVLMDTQFEVDKYGGRIMRPAVIPRHSNEGFSSSHFTLQCPGRVGTKVLEDEMYMSDIIMAAEDMAIKWSDFPLDQLRTISINWEYGVCYPMSRFFSVSLDKKRSAGRDVNNDEDDEYDTAYKEFLRELASFGEAVVYLNPDRHSMMLFVTDGRFAQDECSMQWIRVGNLCESALADGGTGWAPRVELAHEFTLLPNLAPFESDDNNDEMTDATSSMQKLWGGVTLGCTSVQDMQNRMFKLGFGPIPYFRRAGVLVNMSPSESDDDDPERRRLGVVVSHCFGQHGCCKNDPEGLLFNQGIRSGTPLSEDERCYLCDDHPFYNVLFFNPRSAYDPLSVCGAEDAESCSDDGSGARTGPAASMQQEREREDWQIVPVSPNRAFHRAVPVGTKLLVTMKRLSAILKGFQPMRQTHLVKKIQSQMDERLRVERAKKRLREVAQGGIDKENRSDGGSSKGRKLYRGQGGEDSSSSSGKRVPFYALTNIVPLNNMKHRTRKMRMLMAPDSGLAAGADSAAAKRELVKLVEESSVRCFLNVSPVLSCRDGFVCVTMSCAAADAKKAGSKAKNIYVAPQELSLPEDEREWESALSFIYI